MAGVLFVYEGAVARRCRRGRTRPCVFVCCVFYCLLLLLLLLLLKLELLRISRRRGDHVHLGLQAMADSCREQTTRRTDYHLEIIYCCRRDICITSMFFVPRAARIV